MRKSAGIIVALMSVTSGVVATAQHTPWTITELGFSAGSTNTNNRGDVVGGSALRTANELIDLGALPGGEPVTASSINDRGQVVGYGPDVTGFSQAFLWDKGTLTNLGTLGGMESLAFDNNALGNVAGVARTAADELHGFLWRHGVMEDLGPVAFVTAVNNRDQVVGGGFTPAGDLQAFIWSSGHIAYLGKLPNAENSVANDINDRGQVVGQVAIGAGGRAFLWERGAMTDLGTLPGGTGALAFKINNRGQVVGWGDTAAGETHGILWQGGIAVDLGKLPGSKYSYATGINERGDIVGVSESATLSPAATRWRQRAAHP